MQGNPELRAGDMQDAFADPEIDAIQTMRGGYGSAQLIPLLDLDAIAATPKVFVGLSDITALHTAFGRTRWPRDVLRPEPDDGRKSLVAATVTIDRLLQRARRRHDRAGRRRTDERLTVISIAGGRASGRLVSAGCLVDVIYMIGTPWEPRPRRRDLLLRGSATHGADPDRHARAADLEQIGQAQRRVAGSSWVSWPAAGDAQPGRCARSIEDMSSTTA